MSQRNVASSQLADLVEARSNLLMSRWAARHGRTATSSAAAPELERRVADLLRRIVAALREGSVRSPGATAQPYVEPQLLARAYSAMQSLVLELCDEAGCPVSPGEARILGGVVTSDERKGTVFTVRLPRQAE